MTQSPRELAAQKVQFQREQERLLQDLLGILDALDHASDHWQNAKTDHASMPIMESVVAELRPPAKKGVGRWVHRLQACFRTVLGTSSTEIPMGTLAQPDSMGDVLTSAHEGVDMIRRSLLDLLHQRQVTPMEVLGKPFDPTRMYALGRQEDTEAAANTVVQEVVRGYVWKERILREAQVIVAAPTPPSN